MEFMNLIREKTALLHSASENSGFIKRLVEGNATKEGYTEYLYNLHAMYHAIEEGIESNKDNPIVKEFATPELYRTDYIQQDLDYLQWNPNVNLLAATVASVARIQQVSKECPELLVAYAYTRFLADLFGGRTFYSLLQKEYKISEEGLNYYKFDKLGDMKTYVMGYHNKLGGIVLDDQKKVMLLNEISNAYIYNLAISNELEVKLHPVTRRV